MRIFIIIIGILFSSSIYAAPEYEGKVTKLYVNKFKDVLVKLDTPAPDCGDANWPFTFKSDSVVADKWMSMLLFAKASQTPIRVGYEANPSSFCGVVYFYFK